MRTRQDSAKSTLKTRPSEMNSPVNIKNCAPLSSPIDASLAELSISKMNMAQRSELVRRLLSVMMLAQTFDMRTTARTIYDAVVLLIDDIDKARLCLAFSSAITGDMRYANTLRRAGFLGAADEDQKSLMLSFVLSFNDADDNDWRKVPESLLRTSSDLNILRTARLMLDQKK